MVGRFYFNTKTEKWKKGNKKDTPRFATRGIIDYYGLFNY